MSETRARRRIREAVESRGRVLTRLTWEPWGAAAEKEGIPGGWYGELQPVGTDTRAAIGIGIDDVMGLSVEETIAWVDEFLLPPEYCGCTASHSPLHPLIGEDERGLHGPHCKYHLRYRLPWWGLRVTKERE
jgi:hypothetical protein